jgi:class 3 adenylate cyclase
MQKSVQLRWIAEAEAKRVRQFALVQRAASEARVNLVYPTLGSASFGRLRKLLRRLTSIGARGQFRDAGITRPPASPSRSGSAINEPEVSRVLTTVLFTDIVNSTGHVSELGDRRWRALLDRHDDAVRQQITRFHGWEIKHTGDGFVAIFAGPARAVGCAAAIVERTAPLGIAVRIGIHCGEVMLEPSDIGGIAVHIASRIAAIAEPGQPLVSGTVHDLAAGSGLVFENRGVRALRGVAEDLRLYAVPSSSTSGELRR